MLGHDPQHPKKTKLEKEKGKSSGMQGGSPNLTGMSNDLNDAPVDDPEHL